MADVMETTYTEPRLCPTCGYKMDAATDIDGALAPKPGDFGICFSCGAVLRYDERCLPTREASPDEMAMLHPESRAQMELAVSLIRQRGRFPDRGALA